MFLQIQEHFFVSSVLLFDDKSLNLFFGSFVYDFNDVRASANACHIQLKSLVDFFKT